MTHLLKRLLYNPYFYLAVALSALLLFAPAAQNAAAASEVYEFRNGGQSIQASGGVLNGPGGPWVLSLSPSASGQARYSGGANMAVFMPKEGSPRWCSATLVITTSPVSTGGPIVKLPDQKGTLNVLASPGGISNPGEIDIPVCDSTTIGILNGTTITIKGDGASGGIDDPITETPGQREISVTHYHGSQAGGGIGSGVQATISRVNSTTVDDTKDLTWATSRYVGTAVWKDRDPGKYRICIIPSSVESSGCKTVTKVFGKQLSVTFGSFSDVPKPDGKTVSVTVDITVPPRQDPSQTTYGPIDIVILDSKGTTVGSGSTDSQEPPLIDHNQQITLHVKLDKVEATGSLKACIANTEHCTSFTKRDNVSASATIRISAEDSEEFVSSGEDGDTASMCQVEGGLSWILCPLMNTMATLNDMAYSAIKIFLVSPAMMTSSGGSETVAYTVWKQIRNIANVLFGLVFLIIIYSQLTSAGISNYGIKKMLPKLLIGIILVNTSYWIVAIAVDLSNIIGVSIYQVLDQASATSESSGVPLWGTVTTNALAGVGVMAAAGVMLAMSILFPLLVGAITMLFGLVFVLTFRNAMLVILAIVAPLAFVAYLLPNTDGIFKTWSKFLRVLLYIFPVVAFVMGASNVAAAITFDLAQREGGVTGSIMMIIAVGMPAMGIFAALMLAKTMGSIMSKFGITNPLGGMIGTAKDWAGRKNKQFVDTSVAGSLNGEKTKNPFRKVAAFRAGSRVNRQAINAEAAKNRQYAEQTHLAKTIGEDSKAGDRLKRKMAAGGGEGAELRVAAAAKAAASKEMMQNIDNIMSTTPYPIASSPAELRKKFDEATTKEERIAYLRLMGRNGSPGVKMLRDTLTEWTANKSPDDSDVIIMKEILNSSDGFRSLGRDLEVWSNNEHSVGGRPHANFGAVRDDLSVWDVSAKQYSAMIASSQEQAHNQFDRHIEEAKARGDMAAVQSLSERRRRFANRILADEDSVGKLKPESLLWLESHASLATNATPTSSSGTPGSHGSGSPSPSAPSPTPAPVAPTTPSNPTPTPATPTTSPNPVSPTPDPTSSQFTVTGTDYTSYPSNQTYESNSDGTQE